MLDPDRRWLEGKGFRLGKRLVLLSELSHVVVIFAVFGSVQRVVVHGGWEVLLKPGGVGSRLRAELREVKIGTGAIPKIHRLMELTLRIETIKDNAVDGDGNDFDDDLDKSADERPILDDMVSDAASVRPRGFSHLQPAHQIIIDLILEECLPLPVLAGPPPQVLVSAILFALVQDCSTDRPDDYADDEEANGKYGVVNGRFFRPSMAALPVRIDDDNRHGKRDAGND